MLRFSELSRSHPYPPVMGTWAGSCAGWTADFVITTHSQKINPYLQRMSYLTPLSGRQQLEKLSAPTELQLCSLSW